MNEDKVKEITIPAMIDPHFHLREGGATIQDLLMLAYKGGIETIGPMPNTNEGLTTAVSVLKYLDFAKSMIPGCIRPAVARFLPIGMLNEQTTKSDIDSFLNACINSVKIYPLHRTTKSHNGVRDYSKLLKVIEYGGSKGMKFHFHPENPWMGFENRDAEWQFLPIMDMFLRNTDATLVWEHGTDARCIPFWEEMAKTGRFFVTLTAHHLLTNESLSFGDVRAVCKPSIKTERDRYDLISLIKKDYPWVMAGSDSASHPEHDKHKEKGCCACGAFTAPYILPLYAHALSELFEVQFGVEIFERFVCQNARRFHSLPVPIRTVTLVRKPQVIESRFNVGRCQVMPFWTGETIDWTLVG